MKKTSGTIQGASRLFEQVERANGRTPRDYEALLSRLGIKSFKQLSDRLDRLPLRVHREVPWLLQFAHTKIAVPILLRLLVDPRTQGAAIVPLESHAGITAIKGVTRLLESTCNQDTREDAVQALSFMFHPAAHDTLMQIAASTDEPVFIRTHAIEGLANLHGYPGSRSRRYKDAERLVLRLLSDGGAPIRFWACFAVGSMRSKRALPRLRKLARNDRAICPGWWRICEEAKDAIHAVETGFWPDTDYKRFPRKRVRWAR